MNILKHGISINLLPADFLTEQAKRAKFYKMQTIGVGIILLMVFLSSLVVALRILQSNNISQIQVKLDQAEGKVLALKERQASLFVLKNRLAIISQYLGKPSKQSSLYNLLDNIIPSSVTISSVVIDGSNISLGLAVPDAQILEDMLTGFISKETNKDMISEVSVGGLSKGRGDDFRITLKITPK